MLRSVLFLIGGLLAGWLVAAWWAPAPESLPATAGTDARSAPLERRIAALESALGNERAARQALAAELAALGASVARFEGAGGIELDPGDLARAAAASSDSEADASRSGTGPTAERVRELRARRDASAEERRFGRLVGAGFAPDRAEWIMGREAELRLRALEAEYEARRSGEPFAAPEDPTATLRAELGDADYERYLEATGRSTSVDVRDVLAGSPAEQAGLRRGDRLVSYGGQRVYDVGDLNRLMVEGAPGQPVTVDVVRDGQTIQLVIPRGPLGITGSGRFRRGR